jgi:type I restriction enzyme S subunit
MTKIDHTSFGQTQTGSIPEEWDFMRLDDITIDLIGGGTPSTAQPDYWDGDIPWMTSANLTDRIVLSGMRNITKKGLQNSATNIVPKGSLLISTRVGIGKVGIAGIDVAISQDLTGLVPDKNKVNVEYLYWAILNKSSHLSGLSQGSTVKGLTRDYVRTLRIPLPPLLEQQQIAKILSTLDQAIEKVGEAIEKTQRLKKGLLQQLLTKGIGHKEFKDTEIGRIPKEWKSVKLEEISISSPQNGLYKNKESYGNGFKMVRMTELFREDVLIINDMALVNVSKEELARFSLRPGDLLFARRSLKIEGSGKCVLVPKIDESILFESSIIRITLNKTLAYPLFFLYYLNSVGRKQILKMTRTVAVSGITGRDLQNIFIPLPSLYEQQRIAEILSGVDERLELLGKRKERLEIVKRGLMNDLLTGRKRVRIEA